MNEATSATSYLAQLFEQGKVKNFTDQERNTAISMVLDLNQFPYDYAVPGKCFFICNLLCQGQVAQNVHLSIAMANPKEGMFVFMDIAGIIIPFEEVDGCQLLVYDEVGNIVKEKKFRYFGLKCRPRLCVTTRDNIIKRCLVQYRTKMDDSVIPGQIQFDAIEEDDKGPKNEKDIFDAMFGRR